MKRFLILVLTSTLISACATPIPCYEPCRNPIDNYQPLPMVQHQVNYLCININAVVDPHVIQADIENIVNNSDMTIHQWHHHYVYKYQCGKDDPLFYNLMKDVRIFKRLIKEGMDLSHPVVGLKGEITTLADIFSTLLDQTPSGKRYDIRRERLSTRYDILKDNNSRSCKDMPDLSCGKPAKIFMHKTEYIYHKHYEKIKNDSLN